MAIPHRDASGRIAPGAHAPALERFWAKVDQQGPVPAHRPDLGPCWVWTGGVNPRGYGNFWPTRQQWWAAHRWAFTALVARIPAGLTIDHLCRNRRCVNPAHLEPVTMRTNDLRGAGVSGRAVRVTHCPQGHPYDEENTRWTKDEHRVCRACSRERSAARRRRLREVGLL